MGVVKKTVLVWAALATLLAAALPAVGVEATLVADAHVNSAVPAANSGAISNLNVGNGYTALLQFDLSTLPADTTASQVSRAMLRLYCNRVNTAGLVSVQSVGGAWGEYSVTYATLPSLSGATQVVQVNQAAAYVTVDVTSLVQGWLASPATNNGLALTAGTAAVQFDSKENDLTGHAATLDISLAASGTAGPAGAPGAPGPKGDTGATGPQGPPGISGGSGLNFQGVYGSSVNYGLGDVVTFQGSSYVSLIAGNHGNTPGGSPSQWGVLAQGATGGSSGGGGTTEPTLTYQGVYASTTNYALDDIVSFQGSSYISLIASNDGNTPGLSPSQWGVLAQGATGGSSGGGGTTGPTLTYQGVYVPATNYALEDVVTYQGSSYVSLLAGNHGNTPTFSPAQWGLLASAGVGTTGATGPQGPTGPAGLTGATGTQGLPGPTGATGATGAAGLPGLVYQGAYSSAMNYALGDVVLWQGSSYASLVGSNHGNTPSLSPTQWGMLTAQGSTGATGAPGPQGATGAQGAPGSVGPNGPPGPQGAQGIAGQSGAQGVTGPAGAQGLSGPMGPQGPAGPVGMTFRGNYQSSVNYALADGVLYGGAGYVSLVAGNLGHTPDQSPSQWALFATGTAGAAGPAGPAGAQGSIGPTGPQGATGPQGTQGALGPQGPAVANYTGNYSSGTNYALHDASSYGGSTYISLIAGNLGNTPPSSPAQWALLAAQGPAGPAGATGAAGPTGAAGATGATGATGPQGPPVSFQGGWLTSTNYPVGSGVNYAGSSYIALVANTGREPDISPSYWSVLAQAGTAGAPGATGAAGPPGAAGAVGVNYRGAWSSATTYQVHDAALYGGASYLALQANSAMEPDLYPVIWGVLAQAGSVGPSGPAGAAATVSVGTVTTGSAGTQASVTNSGTAQAAVLNFTIPQGAPGSGGGGGGGASGFSSVYHDVSYSLYASASSTTQASTETNPVLTWVPTGCTATSLTVYSLQTNVITVTLRQGVPGSMANTAISCVASKATTCIATGSVIVTPGNFVDLYVTGANNSPADVWMALNCQ